MPNEIEIGVNLAQDFIVEVENLVTYCNVSYIEAIVHFCDKRKIEIETIVPLITKNSALKSRLEEDAVALNFIRRKKLLMG